MHWFKAIKICLAERFVISYIIKKYIFCKPYLSCILSSKNLARSFFLYYSICEFEFIFCWHKMHSISVVLRKEWCFTLFSLWCLIYNRSTFAFENTFIYFKRTNLMYLWFSKNGLNGFNGLVYDTITTEERESL